MSSRSFTFLPEYRKRDSFEEMDIEQPLGMRVKG